MASIVVSLVIPTYNEAENIVPLLEKVHVILARISHEVLVVDDDSPDQTWKIVDEFSLTHSWVRSVRRLTDRGLSSAVLCGFDQARGEILGVMDADLSHDETILPLLVRAVEQGAEMAVGSRRMAGGGVAKWPWYRKLTSAVATWLGKIILDVRLSDPMSGYFVIQKNIYEKCKNDLEAQGYKILLEIYCKGRPTEVAEIPYVFKDRTMGESKLSAGVIKNYLGMLYSLKKSVNKRSHRRA